VIVTSIFFKKIRFSQCCDKNITLNVLYLLEAIVEYHGAIKTNKNCHIACTLIYIIRFD
jgi:hypothetical protein